MFVCVSIPHLSLLKYLLSITLSKSKNYIILINEKMTNAYIYFALIDFLPLELQHATVTGIPYCVFIVKMCPYYKLAVNFSVHSTS